MKKVAAIFLCLGVVFACLGMSYSLSDMLDLLPILPTLSKTFSAYASTAPCIRQDWVVGKPIRNREAGATATEFYVVDGDLRVTEELLPGKRIDIVDGENHYTQVFLDAQYLAHKDDSTPTHSIQMTNDAMDSFLGSGTMSYPHLGIISFPRDGMLQVYDTETLGKIGEIDIPQPDMFGQNVQIVSRTFAFTYGSRGKQLYNFRKAQFVLDDYTPGFKSTFGDSDDFLVYRDHLVDLNSGEVKTIEFPDNCKGNKAGKTIIHDKFFDVCYLDENLKTELARFDLDGNLISEFPLEALGVGYQLIIDTSENYIVTHIRDKVVPMKAIGLRVVNLSDFDEYIIPFSTYTYCGVVDIDDESITLQGRNGLFEIMHDTREVGMYRLQCNSGKPAIIRDGNNICALYPDGVKNDAKLRAYPVDDMLNLDPAEAFVVTDGSSFLPQAKSDSGDDTLSYLEERFGESFCQNKFSDCVYYGGYIVNHLNEIIQQGLGPFYFLKECDDYLIVQSRQWEVVANFGNTLARLEPCQTFSIKQLEKSEPDKVGFEVESTRDDGYFDVLRGRAYLIPWDSVDSLPTAPKYAKLQNPIEFTLLPGTKTVLSFDAPDKSSMISDDASKELEYMALIVESNGLLDTRNSELMEFDAKERPLFDGTPISLDEQRAVSLTTWRVNK